MKLTAAIGRSLLALATGGRVGCGNGWRSTRLAVSVRRWIGVNGNGRLPRVWLPRQRAHHSGSVQPLVAWPFGDCDQRNHVQDAGFFTIIYVYNHTDFGRINCYRVVTSFGATVGNGWASCSM
jgi:hypothetical protein